jgi:CHAT domain-containing protein
VLALGDPAYGAAGSALQVYCRGVPLAQLVNGRAEIDAITRDGDLRLLGADATEDGLRKALARAGGWRSVHLACHGIVHERNPALSALALAPAKGHDGFLTALEITAMTMDTDLAVLSACDTGRGRHLAGEGLLGLARAFMAAGARRVLVSLWPVDDEATRALMARLYDEWRGKGRPLYEALRAAQAHVRSARPAWAHPYYWGAWVLWGPPE